MDLVRHLLIWSLTLRTKDKICQGNWHECLVFGLYLNWIVMYRTALVSWDCASIKTDCLWSSWLVYVCSGRFSTTREWECFYKFTRLSEPVVMEPCVHELLFVNRLSSHHHSLRRGRALENDLMNDDILSCWTPTTLLCLSYVRNDHRLTSVSGWTIWISGVLAMFWPLTVFAYALLPLQVFCLSDWPIAVTVMCRLRQGPYDLISAVGMDTLEWYHHRRLWDGKRL